MGWFSRPVNAQRPYPPLNFQLFHNRYFKSTMVSLADPDTAFQPWKGCVLPLDDRDIFSNLNSLVPHDRIELPNLDYKTRPLPLRIMGLSFLMWWIHNTSVYWCDRLDSNQQCYPKGPDLQSGDAHALASTTAINIKIHCYTIHFNIKILLVLKHNCFSFPCNSLIIKNKNPNKLLIYWGFLFGLGKFYLF